MIRSVLKKPKKFYFITVLILLALLHLGFTTGADEQQLLDWSNKCFSESYDPSGDVKLKKWDFVLTSDAFIRLRKTYQDGKQEYYSFQLHRLDNMNYLGTTDGGNCIWLRSTTFSILGPATTHWLRFKIKLTNS